MATPDPRDASFSGNVFRANFKSVIAKRSDLAQFDGGRLAYASAGQTMTLHAGTVLAQVTAAGPNVGKYVPYASGGSGGAGQPVGILADSTVVDEFGNGSEIGIIKEAVLFKDMLIGLDANAITVLGGVVSIEHGVNLIRVRA